MNEDQLIRTLVGDLRVVRPGPTLGRGLGAFLVWSALLATVLSRGRATSADSLAIGILLVVIAGAALAAIASAIPGRPVWREAALAGVTLVAWIAAAGASAAGLWHTPAALWGTVPWSKCFVFTLVFGALPTIVLLRIVRRGWPVHPSRTAGLTFLAGSAAGALTLALECPSQAPLHLLAGHILPIVCAGATGFALARRLFTPRSAVRVPLGPGRLP